MTFEGEFAEILKEKMGETPKVAPQKRRSAPLRSSFGDPLLNFYVEKKQWIPSRGLTSYPKKTPSIKPIQVPEPVVSEEISWEMAQLPVDLRLQLSAFEDLGAKLDKDKIQKSHLKKQYRILAKKYHPDLQKDQNLASQFAELKKVFNRIEVEIKKLSSI